MRVCVSTQLSDGLRHTEGQFSEGGVSGAGEEPDWLRELRHRFHGLQVRVGEDLCTVEAPIGFQGLKMKIWRQISPVSLKTHLFKKTQNNQITIIILLYSGAKKNLAAILQVGPLKEMRSVMFIILVHHFNCERKECKDKTQEITLYDL